MNGLIQIQFVGENKTGDNKTIGWTVIGLDQTGAVWRGLILGHIGPEPAIKWTKLKEQTA